jgi:hypothetical protein
MFELEETGCSGAVRIQVAQNRVKWRVLVDMTIKLHVS